MPTILDTLKKGTEYLGKHGVEEARLNMEHLVAHVLKTDRMQLYLDFDRPLDEPALESLRELTKRRSRGEPLQHLLGSVEFAGLEFATDARALVPRPESEELVSLLLDRDWPAPLDLIDVGCGSGVIGLSLAAKLGEKAGRVVLSDVSDDALSLARENAVALGLADKVEFIKSDLLTSIDGEFGLVVANLPYIAVSEENQLTREVRNDPGSALYGGERGTEIIERLLHQAAERVHPGGEIALEIGSGQGENLRILAEDLGFYPATVRKDLSGNERFLFAVKPA